MNIDYTIQVEGGEIWMAKCVETGNVGFGEDLTECLNALSFGLEVEGIHQLKKNE